MKHTWTNRILSLLLALIMAASLGASLLPRVSAESGQTDEQPAAEPAPQIELPIVYDRQTLKITADGEEITHLSLYAHEKKDVTASGLPEGADYQWQIHHGEADIWVDIYDAVDATLPVSMALVGALLDGEGAAMLRCMATTGEGAYLSNVLTVTVSEEVPVTVTYTGETLYNRPALAEGGEGEHPEFVTVTINYEKWEYHYNMDESRYELIDMGPAFSSYIATIQYGGSLTSSVDSPTIVGYTPYMDGSEATSVTLNLTNITSDVTYTVNYYPTMVDYSVRYLFQNIYDDMYVELADVEPYTGQGYTGLPPTYTIDSDGNLTENTDSKEGVYATFEGFTALFYQPDTVAADGSTVFEVYYERNYYLMEFDCNGGYGAHTIYVRHGTYVSVPNPTRAGYVFDADGDGNGWDLVETEQEGYTVDLEDGVADELPGTMPPYNSGYKAIWNEVETVYSVVYWLQTSAGNSYLGHRQVVAMSNSQVFGSDDINNDGVYICGETAHTHGTNCVCECGLVEHTHGTNCVYKCGLVEHTHSYVNGVCYSCGLTEHTTHVRACYNFTSGATIESSSSNNHGNPYREFEDFEVYRRWVWNYGYYYYVKIGSSYYQITNYGDELDDNDLVYTLTCHKHDETCKCTLIEHTHDSSCCFLVAGHTHTASCGDCTLDEHTHTDECHGISEYCEYVGADGIEDGIGTEELVTVAGDGSTVVNVYYQYKTYTIRFIYAQTDASGGNIYLASDTGCGQYNNKYPAGVDHNGTAYGAGHNDVSWNFRVDSLPGITDEYYQDSARNGYFTDTDGSFRYYYIALTAQYGADLTDIWPASSIGPGIGPGGTSYFFGSWGAECASLYRANYGSAHANIVGPYPTMSEEMMVPGRTTKLADGTYLAQDMVAWWGQSKDNIIAHAYHNYFELLPGEKEEADEIYTTYNGKRYKLEETFNFTAAHNGNTRVDPVLYAGFDCINNTAGTTGDSDTQANSNNFKNDGKCPICSTCAYCNKFYYDRTSHTLSFYNYNDTSETFPNQTVMYGVSLEDFEPDEDPPYPTGIEPNAYKFDGWYTTPECFENTDVDWDSLTMLDNDLVLYAKWTPIVREVTFYLLYSDIETGNGWQPDPEDLITYPLEVPHGELLGTTYSYMPTREGYQFIGWFYFDENGKKKFAPNSMTVTRDLELFAEWHSSVPTTYYVDYQAWDYEKQTVIDEEIATPLYDYSTAGKTTTFNAKGGAALYNKESSGGKNYQKGWFPETSSHSILMESDSTQNTFTFKYYYKEKIYYKVVYKNRVTGEILGETDPIATDESVVTVKFKAFDGLLPEEYYIQRAIAYDPSNEPNHVMDENIIYFYYVPDKTHALYRIEHYQQPLGVDAGDYANYTLAGAEQGIADLNTTITATVNTYAGFAHVADKNQITTYTEVGEEWRPNTVTGDDPSGIVTLGGLEIRLYYDRKTVGYTVQYVENGTGNVLWSTEVEDNDSAKVYGETLTVSAPPSVLVNGLTYNYYDSTDTVREKSIVLRETADANILIFYYNLKKIPVYYHAVCEDSGLGSLNGVSLGSESAATAANLAGSTAMTGTGFKFMGWYYDEGCTDKVPDGWVIGTHLKPGKIEEGEDGTEHFYALFELIYSSMKISKTGVENEDAAATFLFRIKGVAGTATQNIDLTVAVTGNGTVTVNLLPIGKYTVTELTDWSWKYNTVSDQTVEVEEGQVKNVTFENSSKDLTWLGGESSVDNKFN